MSFIKGDSYLENIMRKALKKENIEFEEQYRVYEHPSDLYPKYMLDFLICDDDCKINVECDGFNYHSGRKKKELDDFRDAWILYFGIKKVLRFNYIDITRNLKGCMNDIKRTLKIYTSKDYIIGNETTFKIYNKNTKENNKSNEYIINIKNNIELHHVDVYTASYALSYDKQLNGGVAYKLFNCTKNISSEIFSDSHLNISKKQGQLLVISEALKKMKRSAFLNIYSDSKWIVHEGNKKNFNIENAVKLNGNKDVFIEIATELKKHNYRFIFFNKHNKEHNILLSKAKQRTFRT